MAATERELAEDAQWKRIQQNTFTRWANEHLKQVSKHIGNLETDLSDGLRLIALIEVLSGKHLPKHNKRPNFKSQKLENVSVALQFLERDENIRIINIGEYPSHVSRVLCPAEPCPARQAAPGPSAQPRLAYLPTYLTHPPATTPSSSSSSLPSCPSPLPAPPPPPSPSSLLHVSLALSPSSFPHLRCTSSF